jgi:hypothetical protein
MAYLIPSYTNPSTGETHSNVYAKIASVNIERSLKRAGVILELYGSQAEREAGNSPLAAPVSTAFFTDGLDGDGNPCNRFSDTFGILPPAANSTPEPAVNGDDILWAEAYAGLKTHPDMQGLLSGATAV